MAGPLGQDAALALILWTRLRSELDHLAGLKGQDRQRELPPAKSPLFSQFLKNFFLGKVLH